MEEHSSRNPSEAPTEKLPGANIVQLDFASKVFLKPAGLRAGWRLLIFIVIFLLLLNGFGLFLAQILRPVGGTFSLAFQFTAELMSLVSALIAAWIMSKIESRPMGDYGLPLRNAFGKLFWQGCLFGLLEICVLIGVIAAFHGYSFGGLAEQGGEMVRWALFWGAFFLIVGFFEEFLFRGYALYTLAEGIGFWPAAVVLAIGFGWIHRGNSGENWVGVVGVLLVGLLWSFTLKRTGSLWFAVGMHAAFDFGETFLFSVPDSGMVFQGHLSNATLHGPAWLTGGTPGPEGSVIDFLILLLFFFVFDRMYPARGAQESPEAASASLQ
jgi:uncharacterized protein